MHTPAGTQNLRRKIAQALLAVLTVVTCLSLVSSSPASAAAGADEQNFLNQTNAVRAQNGLPALAWDDAAANIARSWSGQMANTSTLSHNPNLSNQITNLVTSAWTRIGENVGFGPSVDALQSAFLNSAPHRANILGDYNRVGIGTVRDGGGTLWVTLDFINGPSLAPPPPPPPPAAPTWFLRNTLTTGVADSSFKFGAVGDKVVACDWDGNKTDTSGIFRNGWWYLTNSNPAGSVTAFSFGSPGDLPICGDWDGNGTDTIGLYRNGTFFLRNSNSSGAPDITFRYGNPGDYPTAGDWDGNGTDTIGIWRDGKLYMSNANVAGYADYVFGYGDPGDVPIIGDWNGNGTSELGVVRGASW